MEEIVIYKCADGSRFDRKEDALNYDNLCERIKQIMIPMGERTKDCRIGKIYISHKPITVTTVLKKFLLECSRFIPHRSKDFIDCSDGTRDITHADYMLGEENIKVLNSAMFRFDCTNKKSGREYSQPYFVNHENEFLEFQKKYYCNEK